MFCEECGQLIARTRGTIKRPVVYYHVTATTYPQLNDHEARPTKGSAK